MRTLAIAVVVAVAALAGAARASAYAWPVKPFDQPHPIRSVLNDPRERSHTFHFGVDIAAADWTPVYAVAPGNVSVQGMRITLVGATAKYGYYHVYPLVDHGARVRLHQKLGYVAPGWQHLHFAESRGGFYRNPLRRGALTPFRDATRPTIASVAVERGGVAIDAAAASGVIDVVAEAFDTPPLALAAPWTNTPLAPALLQWRLTSPTGVPVVDWQYAVDFRDGVVAAPLYSLIYAPGTTQNKPNRPGRLRFFVAREWDTAVVENGTYALEVEARDVRGNLASSIVPLTIANTPAAASTR